MHEAAAILTIFGCCLLLCKFLCELTPPGED